MMFKPRITLTGILPMALLLVACGSAATPARDRGEPE